MSRKSEARLKRDRRGTPKKDEVAYQRRDYDKKVDLFFKKDMLLNQLKREGPKIARSFDKLAKRQLKEASVLVATTYGILSSHLYKQDDQGSSATCARLISQASNSFIASVELARHGFLIQHGAMSRSIVETLATALVLVLDPSNLQKFHDGKLKSSKCIGPASKALPIIGQNWGMLSKQFVHIGPFHARLEMPQAFTPGSQELSFVNNSILLNAWLLYVITELVFHQEIHCLYWRAEGSGVVFDPTKEGKEWLEWFDKISV